MSSHKYQSPEQLYGVLFYDIHKSGIFEDEKIFADATAKMHPSIILKTYLEERDHKSFELSAFVHEYFHLPIVDESEDVSKFTSLEDRLISLWGLLKRPPDRIKNNRSSKIPLPYPYIVPGGRFNEIYYWDSYFTMLGLLESGEVDMVESMVQNFKYLISQFGHIPNGNRSYFLSRSQPPFYSLMVKLLIKQKGTSIIPTYLPSLVEEYNFWMRGLTSLEEIGAPIDRVIKLEGNYILNRYYDQKDTPREEMFGMDWALRGHSSEYSDPLYRDIRAACESGWDFSSRWLNESSSLQSIRTTQLLPIDLNCLMWHMEKLISECYNKLEKQELALNYGIIAHNRKKAIQQVFWNKEQNFFSDYNWKDQVISSKLSLAGIYPLFFKLCSEEQAETCANTIENIFLKKGGVVTSPYHTGQQWDAPNGWAPLQWITIKGLLNYGHKSLAQEIASRWIKLNESVYQRTGKMLEKYNVEDITVEGGGGEYPVQDGFGWTNGVYLALKNA